MTVFAWRMNRGEIIRAHEIDALVRVDRARLYPRDLDKPENGNGA